MLSRRGAVIAFIAVLLCGRPFGAGAQTVIGGDFPGCPYGEGCGGNTNLSIDGHLAPPCFGGGCAGCPGDCNQDGRVTIDELLLCVNIALGTTPRDWCALATPVDIRFITSAVSHSLNGCP